MKSKAFVHFLLFMNLCVLSWGQNLVPNYSFENLTACTTGVGEFNGYVADWTGQVSGSGLSLYTHECSGDSSGGGSVPYNYYKSFQYAHTGVSYGAFISFTGGPYPDTTYPYGNTIFANQRNYLQVKLSDSLKTGITYYVTFYVSLMNSCNYVCNDVGAYFSSVAPVFNSNGTVLFYTPQIANDPKKKELNDTLYWMKITGSFVAGGGEKYITIGNFKNDSLSSIRYLGPSYPNTGEAWYYIDDVIVSADSNYADSLATVGVPNISAPQAQVKLYPNPSKGIFNFELENVTEKMFLEVYNTLGERVYNSNFEFRNFRLI